MRAPARLVLSFLASVFAAAPAFATVADDLCAPAANPCIVQSRQIAVTDESVIDLGARDLILRSGSALTVTPLPNGEQGAVPGISMTIRAANVTLEGGTALKGVGADIVVDVTGGINVLKSNSPARIDVSGVIPGTIELEADGDILVQGVLDAGAGAVESDGGVITLLAANASVPGSIDVHGGKDATGGVIAIDVAGAITVAGTVDATGGDGGDVDCNAEAFLRTTGKFDLKATQGAGFGGNLTLTTVEGVIELGGTVDLKGEAGGDGGGDGGELDVISGDSIALTGIIDIRGASPDGSGGTAAFTADVDILQATTILAQGQGQESAGGTIEYTAERKITLGPVNAFGGGQGFGGSVFVLAWCEIELPQGSNINTTAIGGENRFDTGGSLTLAGNVTAGSLNRIYHRTGAAVTVTGNVNPAAEIAVDDNLVPCGGLPTPGCGNDTIDTGEDCDEGNANSCDGDGCSSMCKFEACGNGVTECDEACDDGNQLDGDGCRGDCSRLENVCGDGIVEGIETCDEGNATDCDAQDACSSTCQTEGCNNGVIECGEECDDGLPGAGPCDDACQIIPPPNCGDGNPVPAEGEECDDGNDDDCDACSNDCRANTCGNGRVDGANCPTPLETCDDFNTSACDGCSPTCQTEACGNGVIDCFEQCELGEDNLCLPEVCEQGEFCTSETVAEQACIACETDVDCDPMGACGPSRCVLDPVDNRKECTPVEPPVCDDGNLCTDDSCDAATGCVSTPVVCDDGQACNGSETCDPSQGCVTTALVCDDGDVCSDDTCDDATGCSSTLRTGLALVNCRIAEVEQLVNDATSGIGAKAKKKLARSIKGIKSKLAAAASTKVKKAERAKRAATKQIAKLGSIVTKLGAHIPPAVSSELSRAIGSASQAITAP